MIRLFTLTFLACLFSIASYAVSPINGTDSVCAGSTRSLTDATSGGTWSSSDTSVASINLSTGVVTGISVGVATITYSVGTGIATVTFIVNPAAATILGASTVSAGATITLSDAVGGGTWTSNNTSIATVGSGTGIVTGVTAGTVTIYYVTAGGCGTYHIVTVTGSTSAGPIGGTASACVGNTSTLTNATTGGHWSSGNTVIATVGSSTGIVSAVSAGTCTITYMVGTSIATITFTVNPEAPISGSTTVGVGGTITLSDPVSGGGWLTSNASIATVGSSSGIVTGVAPGTATIYYRTSAPCYSYVIVTVTGGTSAGPIGGTTSACVGNTSTLTDATTGGLWSSSNVSVATIGSSTGVVTAVSAGTCTITYSVGTSIATITFTVNAAATSIYGSTTVGIGGTTTLSDGVSGGAWFSSNGSIATVGSASGVVTGVAAGTVSIYYRTPAFCYTYTIVTVTATSSIHSITGFASACAGNTSTLADSTTGGHWSSSNTAIATVGSSTGVVTAVSAGTCTITYSVGTSIATITFTVNPEAPISGGTTVGVGGTISLSDAVSGGTWITSNASVATVGSTSGIVTGVAPGTATIYYRTSTPCYSYIVVTVTGTTSAGPIGGASHACIGNTTTLTDATTGGLWSSSNTSIAIIGSTTGVVTAVSAGTCTITYMVGTSMATITFTVNLVSPISGSGTVAVGSVITMSDAISGGTWYTSNSSIASVGSTTGIVAGVSVGSCTIYYVNPAGCGTYIIVTVTPTSSIHAITGTASACVGNTSTLADSTTGGHWSSSNTTVATVGSSTGIVTAVSAGTCTITYMVGTSIATITFTINPEAPISGSTTVGIGGTSTLSDAVSGGIWISSNASIATVGSTSGVVTGVAAGTATIYYRTSAPCYSYIIVTVTASSSIHGITGNPSTCVGSTRTLMDSTSGGHWSSSNTSIASVGSSTGVVTGIAAGTCTITYSVGTSIATVTFTVNPVAPITGTTTISTGTVTTFSDAVGGGTWLSSNTAVATVGSATGIVTGVSAGTCTIYYITPGTCYLYVIVTVTATTAIHTISGTASACVGNTSTLTDATAGGHWSSSNAAVATVGSSTGVVTAVSAGTCTITYMVGTSIATITFTVNPEAPISGGSTVDVGSALTLSDAVSGGTWISSNAGVATVGSTSGVVTGVAAGTATIYYRTSAPCYSYVIVTVTASTSVHTISGTAEACEGSTRTLTDATAGGHWSSSNASVATVGSSTGVVTGVSAGTCTITYMVGTAIATITFTVNTAAATVSGSSTVPEGATITLSDAVTGGTWSSNNTGVATVGSSTGVVTGVAPGTATIYYVTPGGCYTYHIVTVTATTPSPAAPLLRLYPNPASSVINISWHDIEPGEGQLTISDMSGHVIYNSAIDISTPTGQVQVQVPVSGMENGIYLFDIVSGTHHTTGRLNVIR